MNRRIKKKRLNAIQKAMSYLDSANYCGDMITVMVEASLGALIPSLKPLRSLDRWALRKVVASSTFLFDDENGLWGVNSLTHGEAYDYAGDLSVVTIKQDRHPSSDDETVKIDVRDCIIRRIEGQPCDDLTKFTRAAVDSLAGVVLGPCP